MYSQKMYELGSKKSTIRTIFEYGKKRAAVVGEDNIYDFSLGNPNVPAPEFVKQAIFDILNEEDPCDVHGYTVASGDPTVRKILAASINERFGTDFGAQNLFMTAGAAASLTICFKALAEEKDEFIVFAPYFPEYQCFAESVGISLQVVPADTESFQINFEKFEEMLNEHTKAVIVNSPNNPSGVIYSKETIRRLAAVLQRKSEEYSHPIFIISDEPYRELVYDGGEVPYIPNFYKNTLVCYSYSKSFSLAGERIGYIVVPEAVNDFSGISAAIAGAARVLTHVNAPSLFQKVVARCAGKPSDISVYEMNRELLYQGLTEAGFHCVKPQGAFYLFPQSMESDDRAFCEKAKAYDLLLVPGSDFGCPGHFRVSYCVKTSTIKKSLPVFQRFVKEVYLEKKNYEEK